MLLGCESVSVHRLHSVVERLIDWVNIVYYAWRRLYTHVYVVCRPVCPFGRMNTNSDEEEETTRAKEDKRDELETSRERWLLMISNRIGWRSATRDRSPEKLSLLIYLLPTNPSILELCYEDRDTRREKERILLISLIRSTHGLRSSFRAHVTCTHVVHVQVYKKYVDREKVYTHTLRIHVRSTNTLALSAYTRSRIRVLASMCRSVFFTCLRSISFSKRATRLHVTWMHNFCIVVVFLSLVLVLRMKSTKVKG